MLEGRNVTLDQVIPTMDILRKNYENTLVRYFLKLKVISYN